MVRLVDVRAEAVPGANRRKMLAQFAQFEKPLILNSTNIKRLSQMVGSTNTAHGRGQVTLYVDENVEFGGQTVGGIRVKPVGANGTQTPPQQGNVNPAQGRRGDIF